MVSVVKSKNILWQETGVSRENRFQNIGQKGATLWFTGLSGAGKSTIAFTLEQMLQEQGYKVVG